MTSPDGSPSAHSRPAPSRSPHRSQLRIRQRRLRRAGIAAVIAAAVVAVALGAMAVWPQPASLAAQAPVTVPATSAANEAQAGVSIPATSTTDEAQVAVFIGDSYTHGTGASTRDKRWTSLVAADMGWREVNLGNGGTGYSATASREGCGRDSCPAYEGVIAEAAAAEPDVVVVAGGQNDFRAASSKPQAVADAIERTYAGLRAEFPTSLIVAVGPSDGARVDGNVARMDEVVRSAAESVGAAYVSLISPPALSAEMMMPDKAHVNDAGHRAIASQIVASLGARAVTG